MDAPAIPPGGIRPQFRCRLARRLWIWLPRRRGGFVCPCCWLALGVGSVLVALRVRWFRLSKLFLGVRCWFGSFAFGVVFGLSVRGGFVSFVPLFGALCW